MHLFDLLMVLYVFNRDRGYGASDGRYSGHRSRSMSRSASPKVERRYRSRERRSRSLSRSVSPQDEEMHRPSVRSPSPRENGRGGYGSRSQSPRRNSMSPVGYHSRPSYYFQFLWLVGNYLSLAVTKLLKSWIWKDDNTVHCFLSMLLCRCNCSNIYVLSEHFGLQLNRSTYHDFFALAMQSSLKIHAVEYRAGPWGDWSSPESLKCSSN